MRLAVSPQAAAAWRFGDVATNKKGPGGNGPLLAPAIAVTRT